MQKIVARGNPRVPIRTRHGPLVDVLRVCLLQHGHEHVGNVKSRVLLLSRDEELVQAQVERGFVDQDFTEAVEPSLKGHPRGRPQGYARLADERLRRPGVVPGQHHQHQGSDRLHPASMSIQPVHP